MLKTYQIMIHNSLNFTFPGSQTRRLQVNQTSACNKMKMKVWKTLSYTATFNFGSPILEKQTAEPGGYTRRRCRKRINNEQRGFLALNRGASRPLIEVRSGRLCFTTLDAVCVLAVGCSCVTVHIWSTVRVFVKWSTVALFHVEPRFCAFTAAFELVFTDDDEWSCCSHTFETLHTPTSRNVLSCSSGQSVLCVTFSLKVVDSVLVSPQWAGSLTSLQKNYTRIHP